MDISVISFFFNLVLFVPFVFLFSLLNCCMELFVQNWLGHLSLPHTVAPAVTAVGARPQARRAVLERLSHTQLHVDSELLSLVLLSM